MDKYLYYEFKDRIARDKPGDWMKKCACDRFEFYKNGEWVQDEDLSLSLSDATRDCCGYSVWDYEELTEEEAMRRIAEQDNK